MPGSWGSRRSSSPATWRSTPRGRRAPAPPACPRAPGCHRSPSYSRRRGVDCDSDEDPCDANVARSPEQGEAGSRPACEVRAPGVLHVCALAERGPLVLALMATRQPACVGALDRLEGLRARHRGLQVAVVSVGGGLDDARELVRARRWSFPVGWDRDGVLASLYGVVTCPYVAVARWRGRIAATLAGPAAAGELERHVARAVAASRRAGWRP